MSDKPELLRSVLSFLVDHANRLDRWALESRKGGWSTHQVAANQEAANECRQTAEKLRAALSSPDDTAERLMISAQSAVGEIALERERQIEVEGYTDAHDDAHDRGELALAASAHALRAANLNRPRGAKPIHSNDVYPSDWGNMKMHDQRRSLIIAAALIVAEIERLDRHAKAAPPKEG